MKKEKIKTIDGVAEELGVLKERGRILDELGKAGLPAGVWALIQNITDEYGQLHEEGCDLNSEDGSHGADMRE